MKNLTLTSLALSGLLFTSCSYFKPKTETVSAAADPYAVPQAPVEQYPTTQYPAYPTTPAPTVIPATPAVAPVLQSGQSYVIQKGDTLYGLSKKFGTSVSAIQQANALTGSTIFAGSTILIP